MSEYYWYSPKEAAERIGLHADTVLRLVKQGKLPAVRISRKVVRISHSDLAEFMKTSSEVSR
jgi:excisionase family DNA binding protein